MKKIYSVALLSFVFFFVLVGQSLAGTYTFVPSDPDLDNLEHGHYYTWGLDWSVPDGETVVGARLDFSQIYNYSYSDLDNVLHVHLLDSATVGVTGFSDDNDIAVHDNIPSLPGLSSKLLDWSDTNDNNDPEDFKYEFLATDLTSLMAYLADGNFGFGFDPDCHFYNNGIAFTVETAPVPIPGAVWLLGSGLLGLLGVRRKRG